MEETGKIITEELLSQFCGHLHESGYAKATRNKYKADLVQYISFLKGEPVSGENCKQYKEYLQQHYKTSSTNSKIAAVNAFFKFNNWDYQIVPLELVKSQPDAEGGLTESDYRQLLKAARKQENMRLYYLMQVLSATKISISEHRYVTVEAITKGYMVIPRGKKSRVIFIPDKLKKDLLSYCKKEKIKNGSVFVNWNGTPLDRSNIHKYLKRLSLSAGVDPVKVNTRSLSHVIGNSASVYMLGGKKVDL